MTARGHATRQENKARRMERILSEARNLIAEEGFDALTISEVAARSQVTIPTVHNLFGKKNDLVLAIFRGLVDNVEAVLSGPELADPIAASEAFIDRIVALYRSDEVFYRAAFMGGERLGLFEHETSGGVFAKSVAVAEGLCARALAEGYLAGSYSPNAARPTAFQCAAPATTGLGQWLHRSRYLPATSPGWHVTDLCR